MKFIKLCMIIGLMVSGIVDGKSSTVYSSAEIESKNEEAAAISQRIDNYKRHKKEYTSLMENADDDKETFKARLLVIDAQLKKDHALLGLPYDETGKDWTKIVVASAGVLMLTAATGGLAGGGIALLLKGTACTAIQLGGAAGGIVGAHGVGKSLSKTGDVDFDEVAIETIPRAAVAGGVVGGAYAIITGVSNGFDGGIGGAIAAYINKSDKRVPKKEILTSKPNTKNLEELKQQVEKVCTAEAA